MCILRVLSSIDRLAAIPLIWIVKAYQLVLSPWMGQQCRFDPTCSVYAVCALQEHGAFRGTGYAIWRVLRCHPWSAGGTDLVPPAGTVFEAAVTKKGSD